VGRANKQDVADVLAAVLDEPAANGKTFELFTLQVKALRYLAKLREHAQV
jgi:uncharacterized protein YbjT (DUF2867 family)